MGTLATRSLSRDQKRKQKLAKRGQARPAHPPHGSSLAVYRGEKYVQAVMRAETGILEADTILDRALTDGDVRVALRRLARELQAPPGERAELASPGDSADLVVARIVSNWEDLFTSAPRHSDTELVGILALLFDSVGNWSRMNGGPRGYLEFIHGFLAQLGVSVVRAPLPSELDE